MTENAPPGFAPPDSSHNQPPRGFDYTVAELAAAVKAAVERGFGTVRVRGEISGFKRYSSGHGYFRLKDADAVLEAVIWRGNLQRLALAPEDGMDVILTGRLTTYGPRSQYQIVVEAVELAGEGALLKLIEERKRRLEAEGLFDPARKKPIPFLPRVIGVVTSPTGAVIRDILHRVRERFPAHVLIWPASVQGERAAADIVAGIRGFNALAPGGAVPRPDVLIVARGGGSLEDLMAFNDEAVVRAAASSVVPLIAAVGHETDTTLIDHAADLRAPTPTAAAERAVPVRADLLARVGEAGLRLHGGASRLVDVRRTRVLAAARGLPDPVRMLAEALRRGDEAGERLGLALARLVETRRHRLEKPDDPRRALARLVREKSLALAAVAARLRPGPLRQEASRQRAALDRAAVSLRRAGQRGLADRRRRLAAASSLLESCSYASVLKRGFAVVRDAAGQPVTAAGDAAPGARVTLEWRDGRRAATLAGAPASGGASVSAGKAGPSRAATGRQGRLL